MSDGQRKEENVVLAPTLGGGPQGVGDPEDRTLRKAEREIMIPQKMKERAKKELCAEHVQAFGECAKEKGLLMPFKCRNLASQLHKCLSDAYKDQAFVNKCTEEYLTERAEFRRTGIRTKEKKKEVIM